MTLHFSKPSFMQCLNSPKTNGVSRYAYCVSLKCSDKKRPLYNKNGVLKADIPLVKNYCPDCGQRLIWKTRKAQ